MTEDVKKFRTMIADSGYEIQLMKDLATKNEKMIDFNQKEVKMLIAGNKQKSDELEQM